MSGHFADVKKLVCKGVLLVEPTPSVLRSMAEFKIIWKVNILSMMKGFGTDRCKLCMKERTEIIRRMYLNQG